MSQTPTPDYPPAVQKFLSRSWAGALTLGILTVILGIMVMAWPSATLVVVAVIIGLQLIFGGIFRLAQSISGVTNSPWLMAIGAVLLIVFGVFALRQPDVTVAVLAIAIGIAWLVTGIIQFFSAAFSHAFDHRGWMMISGAVSAIAGAIVLAQPGISLTALAWITGVYFVIAGVVLVIEAFAARP